ncbi:MAG: DinB family protein [Deltaproteobacteria bacterium]|nr:DinB family protein [Deltaproteobacteria bacterium]
MTRLVDALLGELEQEAATTRRVLERVPYDRLGWKPHAKSMSLGQLALHVASIPGMVAKFLSNDSLDIGGVSFDQPTARSAAELLPALDASVKAAKDVLSGFDDRRAMATWRLTNGSKELLAAPRIAVARTIMLNHWYHHRGQLAVYLRLLNVAVPSIFGPSADENPFAAPSPE